MATIQFSSFSRLASSTSLVRPALLAALAAGVTLSPLSALAVSNDALPTGEVVVGGNASFDRSTANILNIHQSTDRLVVNWDSFNIGAGATTEFFQPNAGSLAINRVVGKGSDPTQILGSLKANGRLMVLDRNGVLFGSNARVDVGGIVASTGSINTDSVMRGDTRFILRDFGNGEIVNHGIINVADGGLAAFVAPTVKNSGVINAKLGTVALAAGAETATVDFYGDGLVELAVSSDGAKVLAENSGVINAESGTVLMSTSAAKDVVDTVVNMTGVINASSAHMVGGKIILSGGHGGKIHVSGKASVSGSSGGTIDIKGKTVEITETATLSSDALSHGNGGSIIAFADKDMIFTGRVSAQGGSLSGDGGFVEASTAGTIALGGSVTTLAPMGNAGTFLIDPNYAYLHNGSFTGSLSGDSFLGQSFVSGLLATNATLTIIASDKIGVGTDVTGAGIGNGSVDYSMSGGAETLGNLVLVGSSVDFIKDLYMGKGSLSVNTPTLNLNSRIYGLDTLSNTVLLNDTRLNSSNALTTINVSSPNAKIQQGISFANGGEMIHVAAGTYNESLTVDKSVALHGTNAVITPNSPGMTVVADNVTVDGFEITGADNGIVVDHANHVTLSNNIIHNIDGDGVLLQNADHSMVTGNTIYDIRTIGTDTGSGIQALDSTSIALSGNIISNTQWDGIRVEDSPSARVENNRINTVNRTGVFLGESHDSVATNNIITNAGRTGINLWYSRNSLANGNRIDTVGKNGVLIHYSTNGRAEDNRIGLTGGAGNITGDGVLVQNSNGASVNGNWITNTSSPVADSGSGVQSLNSNDVSILRNTIWNTAWDGVRVEKGSSVTVNQNSIRDVTRTGVFLGQTPNSSATNNRISNAGRTGIYASYSKNATINGNTIRSTGLNGVLVYYSNDSRVHNNAIGTTGAANNIGGDGVLVDNSHRTIVSRNRITNTSSPVADSGSGVQSLNSNDVSILRNTIWNTAWDGVRVEKGSSVTVNQNSIRDVTRTGVFLGQTPNSSATNNRISNAGRTGIYASYSKNATINGNTIRSTGLNGVLVYYSNDAAVSGNRIRNTGLNGIGVDHSNSATIRRNSIINAGTNGIQITSGSGLTIARNTIRDSAQRGVYAMGAENGSITLSGNRLLNNPIGMSFESGEIDLTGAANRVNGGNVGLHFSPFPLKGFFAPLMLTGDTIGQTIFTGQGTYYVQLANEAFFDPGRPTLLNGLDATYDGFRPSDVGGVLTQAQYDALELMFHHYIDDSTLGLFFFGSVPAAALTFAQEDAYNQFRAFSPDTPSGSLIISGLPSIGGGAPQALGGGANAFANIAPAAGGEDDSLSAIAPAAGGNIAVNENVSDAACWGDATSKLGQGDAVSYSLGDGAANLLNKAAFCSSQNL